jgi:archaeal preflagellin peptidase FlaK
MSFFELVSVINLLVFGSIFSYTDLKRGKIYNKFIGIGFVSGLIILILFYGSGYDRSYLLKVFVNGAIGLIFSYLLWFARKWSAGDAKMYSFFSLFLPLGFYQNKYINFFPAINILINVFIVILVYICINCLIFLVRGLIKKEFKFRLKSVKLDSFFGFLRVMVCYVSVFFMISRLSAVSFLTPVFSNNLAVFFIMYFLYSPLSGNKAISNILVVAAIFILGYLIAFNIGAFYSIISRVFFFVGIIGMIRYCFTLYLSLKETVAVKVKDLKSGAILVENDARTIARRVARDGDNDYHAIRNYGLNVNQVRIIQNLFNSETVLKVYNSFYFGPVMLAGVAITIITRDSLIRMIINVFSAF